MRQNMSHYKITKTDPHETKINFRTVSSSIPMAIGMYREPVLKFIAVETLPKTKIGIKNSSEKTVFKTISLPLLRCVRSPDLAPSTTLKKT